MKKQFNKVNDGFTLMEVLVTILIIGTLGVVASSILFSLLRGAAKTETLKEVKQNGDYALSVMEVKIRNARSVVSPSPCTGAQLTSVTILNPDATQSTFQCTNGRIEEAIVGGASPVTRQLTSTSVAIPTCDVANISFTCSSSPTTGKNAVLIKFTLKQASAVTTAEGASVSFETQVTLRN